MKVDNSFASVFLVSADGLPLSKSAKMYLVATGLVKTEGLEYNENRKQLKALGKLPLLAQVLEGWVLLKNRKPGVKVRIRPLSTSGAAGEPLGVEMKPEGALFQLNQGRTFVYEVTVSQGK